MADIVNLRTVRKAKARREGELAAAENRARHGRTKAEKRRDAQADRERQAHLDAHRLDEPKPR